MFVPDALYRIIRAATYDAMYEALEASRAAHPKRRKSEPAYSSGKADPYFGAEHLRPAGHTPPK